MSVDSFGESCDGSPQPLAVESIAKTSTRMELIIALSCHQGRLIRSRWKKVLAQTGVSGRVHYVGERWAPRGAVEAGPVCLAAVAGWRHRARA